MTHISASRRQVIASLAVAVLPIAATATQATATEELQPQDSAGWEAEKSNFISAHARFSEASEANSRRDDEEMDFAETAPEWDVGVGHGNWWLLKPGEMPSKGVTVIEKLNRRNHNSWRGVGPASLPEYQSFLLELAAWDVFQAQEKIRRGWQNVEDEWFNALNALDSAWQRMVAFPVSELEQLAEKIDLARKDGEPRDEVLADALLDAIARDLRRISVQDAGRV